MQVSNYWRDLIATTTIVLVVSLGVNYYVAQSHQHQTSDDQIRTKLDLAALLQHGSSVWCWGNQSTNRICKFDHLCYSDTYDEFIFVHGKIPPIQHNLPHDRFNPTLLDMSSVEDHNGQYFNFVQLPWQAIKENFNFNSTVILKGNHLVFRRFYPNNMMHVIHDDLIPLYYTLRQYSSLQPGAADIQLIFFDDQPPGNYTYLYHLFSNRSPLYKKDVVKLINHHDNINTNGHGSLVCFQQIIVGISKVTTWYQYGFQPSTSQGPIQTKRSTPFPYRTFTQFILQKLNIQCPVPVSSLRKSNDSVIVIMLRQRNRLIVNIDQIKQVLNRQYNKQVVTLSIDNSQDYNITHQLSILSCQSIGLVGMHGSALILGLFLPRHSFLLELFPYAINPSHYTPYKTMANLPDIQLYYASWTNQIKRNTIAHPDYPIQLGGINHLPNQQQQQILNTIEVPRHSCCQDPNWLYHIYQDTIIDVKSFSQQLTQLLQLQSQNWKVSVDDDLNYHLQFPPSRVDNVTCIFGQYQGKTNLTIAWDLPWTVKLLHQQYISTIQFEIWFQPSNQEDVVAYLTKKSPVTISDNIVFNTLYYIWIRAQINDSIKGPFSHTYYCHTHNNNT